ncbi:MAG: AI-2E family transporter [Nocardioides sp.]|nr:AI-2E family transporter [Nocardioides sp.]
MREEEREPHRAAAGAGGPDEGDEGARWRLFGSRSEEDEGLTERIAQQLAHQWAVARAERRAAPPEIVGGPSNFSRAQVPWALDLAAAWSWRLIVIVVAALGLLWTLRFFAIVTVPLAIALLLAALVQPLVHALRRARLPQGLSALVVMLLGLALVSLLLTFVGQQVAQGASDLADSVVEGLQRVGDWLRSGPLGISESQVDKAIEEVQKRISDNADSGTVLARVTEVGTALGNGLAGFFIVLFATYFFLADGARIWAWIVRLAPRAGRERVDSSGRVAWVSLTQFVRATVVIAFADALGVMLVAWLLGVPFVTAIGVLVFLGAFVPVIGATVAGSVAVLVALVDQGPVTALLMFGGVILVQQIEGHGLQPFLMGRFVSLHPLGVIVALAAGVIVAGIAGALIAVPAAAALNAVAEHLARYTPVGHDEPEAALAAEGPLPDTSPDAVADRHDARAPEDPSGE